MPVIHYSIDDEGIANVVLNDADAPVNTMSSRFQRELAELVERLQADKAKFKGVVFSSAKSSFFAGADLRAILKIGPDDARSFFDEIEAMKACLRRIETLGRPVAAAINGHALGGGLELALACHYRVALDDPRTQIGLPEVSLGLLPGAGGVTKSVRLMGIQAALPFLLEGKRLTPKEALQAGYLHALVGERDALLPNARAWVLAHPDARQPWDDPKHRIPGGTPSSPAVAGMLAMAPAMLLAKTRGNLPAPEAILATAVEGAQVDFDTAMRIETRYLTKLATGQVAKNLIGTFFFQMNEVKAGLSRPKDVPKAKVARVGILGAGMMGSGIAWACANRGVPCVLLDTALERAQKGKAYSGSLLAKRVERNRLTPAQAEEILARITPAADVAALSDCDLIIEAVFENREVKAAITREVEAVIAPTAVFASNTSTLPITGLAGASVRPANFIGLHFFSPVDRMDLVEIIRGRQTSPETVARAYDFVLQIGKTP
ncbi:MAG TPA: 3-hydroxyacyl-CoA dehydrogenase NAD-binding domain-containing protein, partial [Burkholderiaceae bacterium]|nr:3-hydroxyacyl-CoA dehydrogenase NAD-binding domain-containing protein [Burkholderiaceae bacterium]